jgi:hypothetical protein
MCGNHYFVNFRYLKYAEKYHITDHCDEGGFLHTRYPAVGCP